MVQFFLICIGFREICLKLCTKKKRLTSKQKKYLNIAIKLLIVGLAFWFVYSKVSNQKNLVVFTNLVNGLDSQLLNTILLIVLLLMFVNWAIEIVKWKYLVKDLEHLSFWKATKSVFCGLTWAIFTPNRIGEYGGRIMLLENKNRMEGAVLMGVGLFAQLVLTSFFGALSIAWFISSFLDTPTSITIGVWMLAVVYGLGFIILYFNVHWVDTWVSKFKVLQRIRPFFAVLLEVSPKTLSNVLILSLLRFIVFTSQYILLMIVILPEISLLSMILMIFILFFVQAAVPTLDIFDFSVRSFVASNLFSYVTTQDIAVMAIVSCIWFVNLILPAIIGSFFVLNVNYIGDNNS